MPAGSQIVPSAPNLGTRAEDTPPSRRESGCLRLYPWVTGHPDIDRCECRVGRPKRYLVISVALVEGRACFRVRRRSTRTSTDGPPGSSVNPLRLPASDHGLRDRCRHFHESDYAPCVRATFRVCPSEGASFELQKLKGGTFGSPSSLHLDDIHSAHSSLLFLVERNGSPGFSDGSQAQQEGGPCGSGTCG